MLALASEDSTGRFVQEERPLLCPRCATLRSLFSALAELDDVARSTAEFMRLTAQLFQAIVAEHTDCG